MSELRRFLPLALAVAGFILLHQLLDVAGVLPGSDLETPAGRVRQLLATEARSPAVLTADVLLLWALLGLGWARPVRLLGFLHLAVGVVLLIVAPLFLVDAGRVATGFSGAEASAFRVVMARALFMLVLLGIGALLAGRELVNLTRAPAIPSSGA